MTNTPDNRLGMVSALLDAGQGARARTLLAPYLSDDPENVFALCLMARANLLLEDFSAALENAERAIGLDPASAWAWRLISIAARGLDRHAQAISAASTAVELAPLQPESYQLLAQAIVTSGTANRHTVAVAKKAIELDPQNAASHITLGNVYIALRQYPAAGTSLQEALRLEPDNATAMHNLGVVLRERGQLGDSLNAFSDVLRRRPRASLALYNVGAAVDQMLLAITALLAVGYVAAAAVDLAIHPLSHMFPPDLHDAPGLVRFNLIVTMTLPTAFYVLRIRRKLGRRFSAIIGQVLTEDRLTRAWAILLAATYLGEVAATVSPGPWSVAIFSVVSVLLILDFLMIYAQLAVRASRPKGGTID